MATPTMTDTLDQSRDRRPAREPGGCECMECGCIFIGEPWHALCRVCDAALLNQEARKEKTDAGR